MERNFVPKQLKITVWKDIENLYVDLSERNIKSVADLELWLLNRSELEAVLEEDLAWRYIKMNCNTTDKELALNFEFFINNIEPEINKYSNQLDLKFINCKFINSLNQQKYFTVIRAIRKEIEIFRQENIPLIAKLQTKEQEYGVINSKMTIVYNQEEMTLHKAALFLKNTDRNIRETVYRLSNDRRVKDVTALNILMTSLIKLRNNIALNAGFQNFRDYKLTSLGRFDYTKENCFEIHEAIKETVIPLIDVLNLERKEKLKLEKLKPWDLEVDIEQKPPIKPFETAEELIDKTIKCFTRIKPQYGEFLKTMKTNGFLDLDSRKGKAPGGFNYPLYESNIPFIFMNAAGNLSDITTMVHEGGHAIHSFLSKDLELVNFKSLPSEVAELASMSMELISMNFWDIFFDNQDELKRAKKAQLERVIKILPWIATIDKFQHWIYENPYHSVEDRIENWTKISKEFSGKHIDWETCEWYFVNSWQKQLHIFEVPFYYIEYAIAQFGAISIWKNYKQNPEKTLLQYEKALSLGYSLTIPEIYTIAGIKFDFSKKYIGELIDFVKLEMEAI